MTKESNSHRQAPSRSDLHDALDWIEGHKKRSYAHIIVLIIMAACCSPTAGLFLAQLGLGAVMSWEYLSVGFFLAVSAVLLIF